MEANKILTSLVSCNRIGYNIWLVPQIYRKINHVCVNSIWSSWKQFFRNVEDLIFFQTWSAINPLFRKPVDECRQAEKFAFEFNRGKYELCFVSNKILRANLFSSKIRIGKQLLVKLISRPFHWRDLEENAMAVCSQMVWKHNWPHCSLHNPPP